jgi:hypothetical protein
MKKKNSKGRRPTAMPVPLHARQERLKMRGARRNNADQSHATATKASAREYRATFTEHQLSEDVRGAMPDRGGMRVAVEVGDDYLVVNARDVRLSVSIGDRAAADAAGAGDEPDFRGARGGGPPS